MVALTVTMLGFTPATATYIWPRNLGNTRRKEKETRKAVPPAQRFEIRTM